MTASLYRGRRERLAATLKEGIVVVPTAPLKTRNDDSDYPYRFDSNFHYLSGFPEPNAVLVMVLGDRPRSILFCQPKDEKKEIWEGYLYGPQVAREQFGFDEAYPIAELDQRLAEWLVHQPVLHFPLGADSSWDGRMITLMNQVRAAARNGERVPDQLSDVRGAIAEMRLIKDQTEIGLMRQAGQISAEAHRRAMQASRPGMMEYQLEAELQYTFYRHGSRFPAYTSIVASGLNACVLHYGENNRQMHDGELVLIDAGCEFQGYASDITRTFPVNGRFSGPQKAIYELVLAAQHAAIDCIRPGTPFTEPHDVALKVLTQGLIDLKLLTGSVESAIEQGSYRQFYMHKTSHWLGLDVHDAGSYKIDGVSRRLQPGMVLTVEPGLYFRPAANVPAEFTHIGVRIEDDILVTAEGYENLTIDAPKTVADIESVMVR
ncbi:Xaa-Pro aminopeptidase [Parachitinimonas caeni]|uniref:Xaa-Pro aminopeptidase n=1 Tax=Parachitinimonas caeni TaxID=3031301 RepID=A0ABT7DTV6_9NEIS|nr:Xaa-Pro aminopeptidase [Parachitinimonas caeni]MDK2123515.1 Xaa-Pro aminopeptidase [Parachitinimonas caeni]